MSGLLVSTTCVAGKLAEWAVHQSPYAAPDNLTEAVTAFTRLFPDDGEDSLGGFRMKRWADENHLHGAVWATIELVPEIVAWNTPKSEHGAEMVCVSRYDKPSPDDDFIDLHALCRNVSQAAWEDSVREAQMDGYWPQGAAA